MRVEKIRIWDIWVRLFHWSLALSVIFMLISGETGFQFFDWHKPVGEIILGLLVFRLGWGIVGSSNAHLIRMIQNPVRGVSHLVGLVKRRVHPERGHNAAGGWAALILLLSVTTQAVTGLFIADEDEFIEGIFYGSLSDELTYLLLRVHYTNADLLTIFVIIHVSMILVYLVYARTNLITPMITGSMRWCSEHKPPSLTFQNNWIGAACAITAALLVFFLVN